MRRDWVLAGLALPLAAVGGALLLLADFSHTPRTRRGGDFAAIRDGCLDWWCRAPDVVMVAVAGVLFVVAAATLAWGLRRRAGGSERVP